VKIVNLNFPLHLFKDYFLHLFEDYFYDYSHKTRYFLILRIKFLRYFILPFNITMATSTAPATSFAQGQDVSRLRAIVDRSSKDVKDYATQYEDQRAIVESLSTEAQADPVNKPSLDIREVRERRIKAARDREAATITNLANCLIAESCAV
jgi:hypothetical protein